MKLEDKLYWGRFVGGIMMGFITTYLKLYEPSILVGILVVILAYVLSTLILRALLPEEKRRELGRNLYLSGAGTYAAMWLITMIMVYNLAS